MKINYIKFKDAEHAKTFCLSEDCEIHLQELKQNIPILIEKAKSEPITVQGMGYPKAKDSLVLLDYLECEIDRIEMLRDYFLGKTARPQRNLLIVYDGKEDEYTYEWGEYDSHGLGSILVRIKEKK